MTTLTRSRQTRHPETGTLFPRREIGRPVRVLHVLPSLGGGGMELATLRLIRGLSYGVENEIDSDGAMDVRAGGECVSDPIKPGTGTFVDHGLCVLRDADAGLLEKCRSQTRIWILGQGRDVGRLSCWWRLRRVIRRFRPDVVHARTTGAWMDAVLATRGLGCVRLLLSFHGKTHTRGPGFRRTLLNRWAVARADAVLAVSAESAKYIQNEWGVAAERLAIIHNGVNLDQFRPAVLPDEARRVRGALGFGENDRVVVCVANLSSIKGVDVLLRAWQSVQMGQPGARLLLIGDGPLRAELQAFTWKLGCRDSVLFAGARTNVAELLRAADLFVLPSRYEACSNAILEAMASGLAVVACDTGGNRELVVPEVTGWLVPPDSPRALAERMLEALANDSTRRQAGQAAREHARITCGEPVWLEACFSLYRSLVDTDDGASEANPCAG